jgi:hypothetical protein
MLVYAASGYVLVARGSDIECGALSSLGKAAAFQCFSEQKHHIHGIAVQDINAMLTC